MHRATEVEPGTSRIRGCRVLALVTAVFLIASLVAIDPAVAASSKKAEPEPVTKSTACKVLTRKQIEAVLGGDATSTGKRRDGPDNQCSWSVTANGSGRPAGTLQIGVSFDVPPGAYDALKGNAGFTDTPGIGTADALYQRLIGRLNVFKGRRILKLQAVFNDTTTRPITSFDVQPVLVELAKVAEPRL